MRWMNAADMIRAAVVVLALAGPAMAGPFEDAATG